ncbi:MAG: FMN-dependent NADH-azoreductase [Actinomycetes bacterium]
MPTLLHLDASARSASFSRRLGARFAEGWQAAHPGGGYVHRDLAADPVPFIDEAWTEICYELMRRRITDPHRYPEVVTTPARRAAWAVVEPLLDELLAADVVLVSTPMYNFSVPAALKAWIDQVTFPRMSLAGTRFVAICARGGTYLPGTPRAPVEHAVDYLRDFFDGHFGVTDVDIVTAELTNSLLDPVLAGRRAEHEASVSDAEAEIDRLVAASAATAA